MFQKPLDASLLPTIQYSSGSWPRQRITTNELTSLAILGSDAFHTPPFSPQVEWQARAFRIDWHSKVSTMAITHSSIRRDLDSTMRTRRSRTNSIGTSSKRFCLLQWKLFYVWFLEVMMTCTWSRSIWRKCSANMTRTSLITLVAKWWADS